MGLTLSLVLVAIAYFGCEYDSMWQYVKWIGIALCALSLIN